MLKNYFKIAFRNLIRFKTYSLINIAGLAFGITCFIILSLFIKDELSYDKCYKNADNIYRLYVKSTINGQESCNCKTAAPLAEALINDFPDVVTSTRIGFFGNHVLKYKDKLYRERKVYTADSNFFDVFSLPLIYSNPESVLSQPNSIVMTQSTARKYFGNENPVGKILVADAENSYLVAGVMKDFPVNSSFKCDILLSMSTYPEAENGNWLGMSYVTYAVLKDGTDPDIFQKKLHRIVNNYVSPQAEAALGIPFSDFLNKGNEWGIYLQPLTSIYLYSQNKYGIDQNSKWVDQQTSDIEYVYIFSAVAFFILLLAVINFINLTTARFQSRSREVGIKKTLGSNRAKLIGQFITESILIVSVSTAISILLVEITLPYFNQIAGKDLILGLFNNVYAIPGIILFAFIIGIMAGTYPAFYLSSFKPVHLFRSNTGGGIKKSTLRSALVVLQFTVSIALIISTIIVRNQLDYIQNKNLGFNSEYLYSIKNFGIPGDKLKVFEQDLLRNPHIVSFTNSSIMFFNGIPGSGYLYNERLVSNTISSHYLDVDYNFLETYKLSLLSGRFFSKEFPTDSSAVIINEAMNRKLGQGNPIGNYIIETGKQSKSYKIIGVVKDFNYQSLHQQIKPMILFLRPVQQAASMITIRISSANIKNTISFINNTWKNFTGGEEIYSSFVNQDLERLYESEQRAATVTAVFSGLAIFIACLGLFGLTSFVTEQRKKEIGIRKVLGASIFELVTMLSKEFTKWVLLANIIAWPVAWYMMNEWLQNYAYRIDIYLWTFVLSGGIALLIALITVSFQAIKATLTNPVESLRYE